MRTIWRFLLFVLALVLAFVVFYVCLNVVVLVAAAIHDDSFPLLYADEISVQVLLTLPTLAIIVTLVFLFRRWVDRRRILTLGVGQPVEGWAVSLGAGAALGALPILLLTGMLLAIGYFQYEGLAEETHIGLLFPLFILAAFEEELLCRGYLLQNFVDIGKPWLGMVLISLVFALLHLLNPHVSDSPLPMVNLFLAGILFSQVYLITGTLWFPTAMHFAWNFVQGGIFDIPVSGLETRGWIKLDTSFHGGEILTGGEFGLEGSVLAVGVQLLLMLALALWSHEYGRRANPAPPLAHPKRREEAEESGYVA